MITQCPNCSTSFKITPEQLAVKNGLVRCGRCAGVFNGYQALRVEQEVELPPPAPPVAAQADVAVAQQQLEAGKLRLFDDNPTAREKVIDIAEPSTAAAEETIAEPATQSEPAASGATATTAVPASVAAAPAPRVAEPLYQPDLHQAQRGRGWGSAALLLLLLLAAQVLFYFRAPLARQWPALGQYLASACEQIGCEIALAQSLQRLNIEASDLEADRARKGVHVLHASLRNQAPYAQRYPDLELTLTGVDEQPLAVRTFTPAEYLSQDAQRGSMARSGWDAQSELTVNLQLDTSQLTPAGFRLRLVYR